MGARNRKFVVEIDGQEVEVPRNRRSRADRCSCVEYKELT